MRRSSRRTIAGLVALALAACGEATDEGGPASDGDAGPAAAADAAGDPRPMDDAGSPAADCACDEPDGATPDGAPAPPDAAVDATGPAPDAASLDAAPPAPDAAADAAGPAPDAAPSGPRVIAGGDVSGRWCGVVEITDSVTVREGDVLEICPGADIRVAGDIGTAINVVGRLHVRGTAEAPVRIGADGQWRGLRVAGTLEAAHLELTDAGVCLEGLAGSDIRVTDARLERCRATVRLENGGDFDRTVLLGGASVVVTGGVLRMTDSVLDLEHPTRSPDCTAFNGGGAILDHVRFTGCHCPLHINRAPEGFEVTNSVFDDAAYPVMIAHTHAVFRHNHFSGVSDDFLDVGGGIDADIAGNYFGGGPPDIGTRDRGQFRGADEWSPEPFDDVGPRL